MLNINQNTFDHTGKIMSNVTVLSPEFILCLYIIILRHSQVECNSNLKCQSLSQSFKFQFCLCCLVINLQHLLWQKRSEQHQCLFSHALERNLCCSAPNDVLNVICTSTNKTTSIKKCYLLTFLALETV